MTVGTAFVTFGDIVRFNFSPCLNITRRLRAMKARPTWAHVNTPLYDGVASVKNTPLVAI
ncbi:MAG: hypothetical protein OEZ08_14515 [Betaproteobacteria bacterium]|nr:hypothetical protein [Betaproteobacteria bacterium]